MRVGQGLLVFMVPVLVLLECLSAGAEAEKQKVPEEIKDGLQQRAVRPAMVAGQFYPAQPQQLRGIVAGYLEAVPSQQLDGRLKALVVPHAGYVYSGQSAAFGYKVVPQHFKTVFLLASNHSRRATGFAFSVADVSHFRSPLGKVKVSPIASELLQHELFSYEPAAHATHVIEVHLPFLQTVLPAVEIVPVITGRVSPQQLLQAAAVIGSYLNDETLLIVSSDLSHYHPYDKAVELDRNCTAAMAAVNIAEAESCEACGLPAALMLLKLAEERGWQGQLLDYRNSGDSPAGKPHKDRVVGYSSIAFYAEEFKDKDKVSLLDLSRRVLQETVSGEEPSVSESDAAARLRREYGCFVTLKKEQRLRGCIGHLEPVKTLFQCVVDNTVNAALHDRRFQPVAPEELEQIEIEISILTPPAPYRRRSSAELLDFLVPRRHGVILRQGAQQSTFLPQVWEDLPRKRDFLGRLCLKGGLPGSCWQDLKTEVLTYEAIVFNEQELHSQLADKDKE